MGWSQLTLSCYLLEAASAFLQFFPGIVSIKSVDLEKNIRSFFIYEQAKDNTSWKI
jgi:hypothetical protein